MKRCVLILTILALPAANPEAANPETPRITILSPQDGLRTHRPTLGVAVRFEGAGEAGDEKDSPVVRRLELYCDGTLVAERSRPLSAGGTAYLDAPFSPHAAGRVVLTAVAWLSREDARTMEASVEIEVWPGLRRDLANPDDDDDQDGLTNFEETVVHGTDPTRRDTDGDAFWDGAEVEEESDPLAALSIPPMTLVAAPPAAVLRRETPDLSAVAANTVVARPPAAVVRPESGGLTAPNANLHLARPTAAVVRKEPLDAALLTVGPAVARPPVRVEAADAYVFLVAREKVPAAPGEMVTVPLELLTDGAPVASLAFSIDYDTSCLDFDSTDGDGDGTPDALAFNLPAGWLTTVFADPGDPDGELDVFVFSNPVAVLPSGPLATLDFRTTCSPMPGDRLEVPVAFSFDPRSTFGDVDGHDLPGAARAGSVEILGGLRGDCNGSGVVTAADFPALLLELFDGDGDAWIETPRATFPGNPVGCDANADTVVDAGDLSCTGRLLFRRGCAESPGRAAVQPRLILGELRPLPWGNVVARLRLEGGAGSVTSVAFSLDLDPDRLGFDPRDSDGDGVPDAVRFLAPTTLRAAVFDSTDGAGELDIVLSDFAATPRPFDDAVLVEVELTPQGAAHGGLSFAADPAPSFGGAAGQSLPGEGVVELGDLFADGFESGDTGRWSRTMH